jgi:hypothetical protein
MRRETAKKIVEEYLAKIGGREALMEAWEDKKNASKKGEVDQVPRLTRTEPMALKEDERATQ